MGGYMETPQVSEYIVRWGLPNESGIIGSLLLAEHEHQKVSRQITQKNRVLSLSADKTLFFYFYSHNPGKALPTIFS